MAADGMEMRTPRHAAVAVALVCGLGSACVDRSSDPDLIPIAAAEGRLVIEGLDRGTLDLGDVAVGTAGEGALTLRNSGSGPLELRGLQLLPTSLRWGDDVRPRVLDPGESVTVSVRYVPAADESVRGEITIALRDGRVELPVRAEGLAPRLSVPVHSLEMGIAPLGCSTEAALPLRNDGRLPLLLGAPRLEPIDGAGAIRVVTAPPLVLPPGEQANVRLAYDALAPGNTSALLWIDSNDPRQDEAARVVAGSASLERQQVDSFVQAGDDEVDVVFVVPGSGDALHERLGAAFASFLDGLPVDSDFRVAVISQDPATEGALVAPWFDSSVAWPGAEFAGALALAPPQVGSHAGLESLRLALVSGVLDDFRRPRAGLRVVLVSDRDDAGGSLGDIGSYVALLRGSVPHPGQLRIDDISGGSDGCSSDGVTGAPSRWNEASQATGGESWSICAGDWDGALEGIGFGAEHSADTFELPGDPLGSAPIRVLVEGEAEARFSWDPALGALVFDPAAVPANCEQLDVAWMPQGICGP